MFQDEFTTALGFFVSVSLTVTLLILLARVVMDKLR